MQRKYSFSAVKKTLVKKAPKKCPKLEKTSKGCRDMAESSLYHRREQIYLEEEQIQKTIRDKKEKEAKAVKEAVDELRKFEYRQKRKAETQSSQ
uniref:TPX2 domain-containing protein n=1 Tax=Steinernema glaseri TaxID=37863 RepID=A0A1I7ZM09_9BILA